MSTLTSTSRYATTPKIDVWSAYYGAHGSTSPLRFDVTLTDLQNADHVAALIQQAVRHQFPELDFSVDVKAVRFVEIIVITAYDLRLEALLEAIITSCALSARRSTPLSRWRIARRLNAARR